MTTLAAGNSPPRLRATASDGQSVWIHDEWLCIARFGAKAYEIHSAGETPMPLLNGRHEGIADWIAFRAAMKVHHDYDVPVRATPHRYWDELGIEPVRPVSVPLSAIRRHFDPLVEPLWRRDETDRATVARMIAEGRTAPHFIDEDFRGSSGGPLWDARRIAHFVLHFEPEPMEVCVTSNHGHVEVVDGLHRLAAAIYREDARFNVLINGDEIGIALLFPDQAPPVTEPVPG